MKSTCLATGVSSAWSARATCGSGQVRVWSGTMTSTFLPRGAIAFAAAATT